MVSGIFLSFYELLDYVSLKSGFLKRGGFSFMKGYWYRPINGKQKDDRKDMKTLCYFNIGKLTYILYTCRYIITYNIIYVYVLVNV